MPDSARADSTSAAITAVVLLLALSLLPIASGEAKYHLLEVGCALAVLLIRRYGRPDRSVGLPLGLLLAWSAASIGWSPDRRAAVASLLWILALIGIFSLFCPLGRRALARLELAYLAIATPTMLIGLAQYQGLLAHPHWANQIRLSGPFVNSNIYAAFVSIALVLGLARASDRRFGGGWRTVAVAVSAIASLNLVLTVSRGGWLAAGCGIAALVLARSNVPSARSIGARLRPLGLAIPVVLATIVIAAKAGWLSQVEARLRGAGTYSVGHRAAIYAATLGMIRAHPLGVGLAGYPEVAPAYRLHTDRFLINFAHSDVLELVALLGIPGAALAAVALGRLNRLKDGDAAVATSASAAASTAVLTLLAAQSCIDFPLRQPVIGLYVAATLGALAGGATGRRASRRGPLLVGAVAVIAGALSLHHGEGLRDAADALAAEGALPAAAERYRRADRWLFPGDPANARALGAVNARLAAAPLIGGEFLARARAAYATALRRGRWSADAHLEAAILDLASGRPEAARPSLLAAVRLAPRDREIALRVSRLFRQLGDRRTALELEAVARDLHPTRAWTTELVNSWARSGLSIEPLALAVDPAGPGNERLAAELMGLGRSAAAELVAARSAARWSRPR